MIKSLVFDNYMRQYILFRQIFLRNQNDFRKLKKRYLYEYEILDNTKHFAFLQIVVLRKSCVLATFIFELMGFSKNTYKKSKCINIF